MAIEVLAFKNVQSGVLRGFADIRMPSGMEIRECPCFMKNGRSWATPPGKPVVGRDGSVAKTPEGRIRYVSVIGFADKPTQDRWSDQVIEALRDAYPEALTLTD